VSPCLLQELAALHLALLRFFDVLLTCAMPWCLSLCLLQQLLRCSAGICLNFTHQPAIQYGLCWRMISSRRAVLCYAVPASEAGKLLSWELADLPPQARERQSSRVFAESGEDSDEGSDGEGPIFRGRTGSRWRQMLSNACRAMVGAVGVVVE
jgi:hypothetical protein